MRRWVAGPTPWGVWLITCLVVGLLFAGGVVLYSQVGANRVRAIEELCRHDNANAQHNIDFLRFDVQVDPQVLAKARNRFKLTPDCHAFAKRTVNQKP